MIRAWENFKVEGEKVIFTIPKPKQRYSESSLKVGLKLETDEYREWTISNEHFTRLNSVSKETREKVLKKFKEGGINIRDTAKFFGLKSDVVGDIILFNIKFNIKSYDYLSEDSI